MITPNDNLRRRIEALLELIEIPQSSYELATKRYESLGDWFTRDDGPLKPHRPEVYPQGSFRLGTVIRPLLAGEEYDLDLVLILTALSTMDLSQQQLKSMTGGDLEAYVKWNGIKSPVKPKKRCWRLDYADSVKFHMDILPSVPQNATYANALNRLNVPWEYAQHAIAITDNTHHGYTGGSDWPASNPKGFATWFDERMRIVAKPLLEDLVNRGVYASVDDVPTYRWKTPLQQSIQIMKRHRDVMFKDQPELKPISMIIAALSARAYGGEGHVDQALATIVEKMPGLVRPSAPRVPNPVNPEEDFADKWAKDDRLEPSFWSWHTQLSVDLKRLSGSLDPDELTSHLDRRFGVKLSDRDAEGLAQRTAPEACTTPTIVIKDPPKPWRTHG